MEDFAVQVKTTTHGSAKYHKGSQPPAFVRHTPRCSVPQVPSRVLRLKVAQTWKQQRYLQQRHRGRQRLCKFS